MNIEIHGAGFKNKGAQLMLATTCKSLREALPCCRLCISQGPCTFRERAKYALYQTIQPPAYWKIPYYLVRDAISFIKNGTRVRIYPRTRKLINDMLCFTATNCRCGDVLRVINSNRMNALVDISGYGFGDCWPVARHKAMLKLAKKYWKRKKPVILLPQMFGPFDDPQRRTLFLQTANYCTKIYAREQASYDWLVRIGIPETKLGMAPDITIFSTPETTDWQSPASGKYACLVPNVKMLEQTDWGDQYIEMMVAAAKYLQEKRLEVFIVQHETGKGDSELARTIKERLDGAATIFHHEDAQILKKFIGDSELLIGSRYHSIVAALSQGVPAVAMGWAHKYGELLNDFEIGEFILHKDASPEDVKGLIQQILDPSESRGIRECLKTAKENMLLQNQAMWKEVNTIIGS